MRKSVLHSIVLLLATFLLISGKAVANEEKLGPLSFNEVQEQWLFNPLSYENDLLCKKSTDSFFITWPHNETNYCSYENFKEEEKRELSSIN